jgi:hypothetical protein
VVIFSGSKMWRLCIGGLSMASVDVENRHPLPVIFNDVADESTDGALGSCDESRVIRTVVNLLRARQIPGVHVPLPEDDARVLTNGEFTELRPVAEDSTPIGGPESGAVLTSFDDKASSPFVTVDLRKSREIECVHDGESFPARQTNERMIV